MIVSFQLLLIFANWICAGSAARLTGIAPSHHEAERSCFGVRRALRKLLRPRYQVQNASVAIIGSGKWGTTVAKIVAENVERDGKAFHSSVNMYVFDETIADAEGKQHLLSEYINEHHENIKYLKGVRLPTNLHAEPDISKAVEGADVLVWVAPDPFLLGMAAKIQKVIRPTAVSVSLVKGHFDIEGSRPKLLSEQIRAVLGGNHGEVSVLMGATLADEVADGKFAEATLGCRAKRSRDQVPCEQLQALFNGRNFRVDLVPDIEAVEISGSLRNVIALAAGFSDGVDMGNNAKAAIVRHGLSEIEAFVRHFYPSTCLRTSFESAGLADLIMTCYGGQNHKCAEEYARSYSKSRRESWTDIEKRLLNGQKLQGTLTIEQLQPILKAENLSKVMPLHMAVYGVVFQGRPPTTVFDALKLVPASSHDHDEAQPPPSSQWSGELTDVSSSESSTKSKMFRVPKVRESLSDAQITQEAIAAARQRRSSFNR
eukprot:TRINITY_DN26486_c0_g1_i1.p1 TRINITY_DN26486_c0_g1~~TRINITY_DN26486_c0_g1_i1.p1  ORF type:complete len:486 (-),score=105.62 TRINITY_DN26486_c0_g1_i1:122-1579(-)